MRINNLNLKNFRLFSFLEVEFHPNMTVITSGNGYGKTTILDAIAITLGMFIESFGLEGYKYIDHKDVRCQRRLNGSVDELMPLVSLEARFDKPASTALCELVGKKNKTTIKGASDITDYGKQLMQQVSELKDVDLPVVSYYGSGRLWNTDTTVGRKLALSESRTMGYEDCLISASSFKQVQQWMSKATHAALQQKEIPEYSDYKLSDQLDGIKQVVNRVLAEEGWSNFHFSFIHEELAMHHEDYGVLPVSLLSSGLRAMISLTADLAWRCAKLNPHLGIYASAKTHGIVLIDEVDMHLHPSWQQRVIEKMQSVFHNVQFITTTHSPQVLSTVHKECIRVLGTSAEGDDVAATPRAFSYGEPSNDVLQAIMHVDPQPPVPEKNKLDELTSLVDHGEYQSDRAKQLLVELRKVLNEHHPQLFKIERSIRRQCETSKPLVL